jgi:hypothetical protein
MPRQRQRMLAVDVAVEIRDGEIGAVDGRAQGHGAFSGSGK